MRTRLKWRYPGGTGRTRHDLDTYGHLYEDVSDLDTDAMGAAFAAPTAAEPSNVRQM